MHAKDDLLYMCCIDFLLFVRTGIKTKNWIDPTSTLDLKKQTPQVTEKSLRKREELKLGASPFGLSIHPGYWGSAIQGRFMKDLPEGFL